jgi:hypothetical protein
MRLLKRDPHGPLQPYFEARKCYKIRLTDLDVFAPLREHYFFKLRRNYGNS